MNIGLKKKVGNFMTNKKLRIISKFKKNGSSGGKIIGAGGGGF